MTSDKVHRRRTKETANKYVRCPVVQIERRTYLFDAPALHHHDPIRQRRLDLIVRNVEHRAAKPLLATHDPNVVNEVEDASVLSRQTGGDGSVVWALQPSVGEYAIQAAASDNAGGGIAVGRHGSVYRYGPTGWTEVGFDRNVDLNGVAFDRNGRAIVVGVEGTIAVLDGDVWTDVRPLSGRIARRCMDLRPNCLGGWRGVRNSGRSTRLLRRL